MEKPTECRWCKSGVRLNGQILTFKCWTIFLGHAWSQSPECKLQLNEDRIQRAVDTLKAATRYTVTPGPRNTLDWDTNPDGSVTDSAEVDKALAILEGDRDE